MLIQRKHEGDVKEKCRKCKENAKEIQRKYEGNEQIEGHEKAIKRRYKENMKEI